MLLLGLSLALNMLLLPRVGMKKSQESDLNASAKFIANISITRLTEEYFRNMHFFVLIYSFLNLAMTIHVLDYLTASVANWTGSAVQTCTTIVLTQ